MKKLISESGKDFILEHSTAFLFENNKKCWTDEQNQICATKGYVNSITYYENEYSEFSLTGNAKRIQLSVDDIKKLHAAILEIEAFRSEEKYYEDYF